MKPVRAGDIVRVRSREEILATLDSEGSLEALPFMPEMLKFAGQEMRVSARAHKTCDTVESLGSLRELDNAVHLASMEGERARCDGSAHGGCQAQCVLFFREEWLTTAPAPETTGPATVDTLYDAAQQGELYSCQATAMRKASRPSQSRGHFVQDLKSRNVGFFPLARGMAIQIFNKLQWESRRRLPKWMRLFGGRTYPFWQGTGDGKRIPSGNIQPGDLVEVRSKAEIMPTLNAAGKNGGMLFDAELLPWVGKQARVSHRVEQIIDEPSGRMIKLQDCLVLEDVICLGLYHRFCPRATHQYWREAWLRKIDPNGA